MKTSGGLSPFFCQNQLSDFMDGLLPASRADEVKKTLDEDRECAKFYKDFQAALEVARAIPHRPMNHDLALRIVEACESGGRRYVSRMFVSRLVLFIAVPVLVMATLVTTFPSFFPWMDRFTVGAGTEQFVRYFPLLQGAEDLVEEQANWLQVREPLKLSVWEEGGLSPEEFEKSFQTKSPVGGSGDEE